MSQTEYQLDSGGGINDLFFDAEQQERLSGRFMQFEIASIRGCILYTNHYNNFPYNCISRQVGFFQS